MPTEQRDKFVTSALKALLFLFFSLFLSFSHAAGFGRLTVLSSLGQTLRAEIELLDVSPEEAATLSVTLAPASAYRQSGIDYTSLLQSLDISVEKEDGRHFVRIQSRQPVNEPYIGILLELSANGERKGREFVIMLDSAEWTNLRSAPLSSAASRQRLLRQQLAGRQSSRALPAAARPAFVLPEKEDDPGAPSPARHVVSRGDTLSKIAARLDNRNISLEQMLVALYRNNPDAFLDNNMNLLREGAVLAIPQAGDADPVSRQEARRIVRLHAADFHRYSQRLAGMVKKSAPRHMPGTGPVAEGRISTRVKEPPTPANQSPDRLELSRARSGAAAAEFTAEEKMAMNRAIEDANRRITELEKNVSELRSLLEIVSKNGSALTKPAEKAETEQKTGIEQGKAVKPEDAEKTSDDAAEKTGDDSPQTATGIIEKAPSSDTAALSEEKKDGLDPDQTLGTAGKKAEAVKKTDDGDEDDEEEEAGKKPGLWGKTLWFVAIGITLALLVLVVILIRMRRKKPEAPAPAPSVRPPKEKEEEYVNPNIISGRDFLESLTGREVMDDEDDEDAYRPMRDDDEDDDADIRYADEKVQEETGTAEREPEPEETVQEEMIVPEEEPMPEAFPEPEAEPEAEPEPEAEEIAVEPEEEPEPEQSGMDDQTIEMTLPEDDSAQAAEEIIAPEEDEPEPASLELDLSDINLEPEAAGEDADFSGMARPEEERPEPDNPEMAAKLELALAYMDMKDKDGARELLEEVIDRGTPTQVSEARQAMQYL